MSDHPWPQASKLLQWAVLLGASLALAFGLNSLGLPAALLLGPMIVGIACGCAGMSLRVARAPVVVAQAVIGCLIAAAITGEIVARIASGWALFLGIVVAMNAISAVLGWLISRRKILPGTTAIWGSTPGGASAMMLMSEAFGADPRLVAIIQY